MKKIEVVISERFYIRGKKIFQHFVYDKKHDRYMKNHKLDIYDLFETKVLQKSLNNHFIKRREEPGRSVLEYEYNNEEKPPNSYFTILSFLPDYHGCDFCMYRKDCKAPFIWCEIKQKTLSHKVKNCKFFRQKR